MAEEENVAEEKKEEQGNGKKITAKDTSKFFKFFCGFGLVVSMYLLWLGILTHASLWEVVLGWGFVYGLGAGTIDFNIFVDKMLGAKK